MGVPKASRDDIIRILTLHREGKSYTQIGNAVGRHRETVKRWILRDSECKKIVTPTRKEGSGRARKTSRTTDRLLRRVVLNKPSISARELKQKLPNILENVSIRTIQHRLQKDLKMPSRRAAKKPFLSAAMKVKRLKFAMKYQGWTPQQWDQVMFSDESAFKTFSSRPMTVRRSPGSNRYDPKYTQKTVKHPDGIMVWGCYSSKGRGGLYFLPKNTTMNGIRYIEVLEDHLLSFIKIHGTSIFQHDSAPCHKAKLVTSWLISKNVDVLEWPGNSPDLNPIENMWKIMKDRLQKHDTGSVDKLKKSLISLWLKEITPDYCRTLSHSMPKRLLDVIKAKGAMTKY